MANGHMSNIDPNTTNTNACSARILPCCSHRLSLVWWWTHPAPTSWMMEPRGSVHPNLSWLSIMSTPPLAPAPSSALPQQGKLLTAVPLLMGVSSGFGWGDRALGHIQLVRPWRLVEPLGLRGSGWVGL